MTGPRTEGQASQPGGSLRAAATQAPAPYTPDVSAPGAARFSYHQTLVPAVVGVILGILIARVGIGDEPRATVYAALPQFVLWMLVIVAQTSVYLTLIAGFGFARTDTGLPRLPRASLWWLLLIAAVVIFAPNLVTRPARSDFPLPWQHERLISVVTLGIIAILFVLIRVARVYAAYATVTDPEEHASLRRNTREMLAIGALVVTLATLGSGVLQNSLAALADIDRTFRSFLAREHVLAYGGYFALLLLLFFAPVLLAEREAAERIVRGTPPAERPRVEDKVGLHVSLADLVKPAFSVLAPVLGALTPRLFG